MSSNVGRMARELRCLLRNPRYVATRISARLHRLLYRMPSRPIEVRRNGVIMSLDPGLGFQTEAVFHGDYEPALVSAMKRFVRRGDTFIDVGASIGTISCIALGLVGTGGQVHSFEPVPEYFERLRSQASANRKHRWIVSPFAVGDTHTTATIAVSGHRNIGWNTLVPNFMPAQDATYAEVSVLRLDTYIQTHMLEKVTFVKIDTEGFEYPVVKGLKGFLDAHERPAIACEVAPAAYPLLGCRLSDLAGYMSSYDYSCYAMDDYSPIAVTELERTTNVLFLPR